nr:uncharacterized protein LOC115257299 [Aedes albopictus]
MATGGTGSTNRVKRIVDSRRNAHGRVTRLQTKNNKPNDDQRSQTGPSVIGVTNEAPTAPVILELINPNEKHPNHPCDVGKFLKAKGFNNFGEIRQVGRFRFKIESTEEQHIRKIKLSDGNLQIYEPKSKNQTMIFVRGVPLNFEEEEMLANMEAESPVLAVQRMKRRARNNELVDTYNVKVTVEGGHVPGRIRVYGCSFRAELYIFPIRQCKNCWRYGHGASHCTSKTRCAACGGEHDVSVCNKGTRCPNCKRGHQANDPACPEMQRHKNIRSTMKEKQIPFNQAASFFPRLENQFDLLSEVGEGDAEPFPTLGGVHRKNKTVRSRRRSGSTTRHQDEDREWSTTATSLISPTQASDTGARERQRTGSEGCPMNPLKATDLERFISWLRQGFLAETRAKRWLVSLKDLSLKIAQRIQTTNTELERDQLLIEISQDIQQIIEENDDIQQETARTNQNQHSGV